MPSVRTFASGTCVPSQWIRYRRQYFADLQRRVRVTLDTELAADDQSIRANLARGTTRTRLPRLLIVEVKYAPRRRGQGAAAVRGAPAEPNTLLEVRPRLRPRRVRTARRPTDRLSANLQRARDASTE